MCIAIFQPAGKELPKETLANCWKVNDDGAGMLYTHNGTLYAHKELISFEDFYDYYKHVYDLVGEVSPMVLHFRIKTHGLISYMNCHPFLVNENLGFVHNGILSNVDVHRAGKTSDTYELNKQILQKLPTNFLKHEGTIALLKKFCSGSKLVFLDNEGNHTIINENLGSWDDGVWFSNTSYKGYRTTSTRRWNTGNAYGYNYNRSTTGAASTKSNTTVGASTTKTNGYNYGGTTDWDSDTGWRSPYTASTTPTGNSAARAPSATRAQTCQLCQTETLTMKEEKEYGVCEKCMMRLDWSAVNTEIKNDTVDDSTVASEIQE